MFRPRFVSLALLTGLVLPCAAAEPDAVVRPFLAKHCLECHKGDKPEGDLRLDKLSNDFTDATNRRNWQHALKRVKSGEMPPKEKPKPTAEDVRVFSDWIIAKLNAENQRRAAAGRVVLRRLNRVEYENTIRDLLGIEIDLKESLPQDTSAAGFDNVGEALHTSSYLMDRYLEAADAALNVAIANLPQSPLLKKRYSLKDERIVKNATERVYGQRDDGLAMFSSSAWNAITVGQFYPTERGKYRIRISAYGVQSPNKPVAYRVDAGPMLMATKSHLVGYFDAKPDEPTVVEFIDYFEARNHIRIHPYGLASAQAVHKVGADKFEGPGLVVQWIDVEGPLHEAWPPESHRRIFGDLPQVAAPIYNSSKRVEVASKNAEADASRILRDFARRAFRRPVTDAEVKPFVELVQSRLGAKQSFEQAMRVGLKAVMVSPEFLFLREKPGPLDDHALASRLSYFLWSTMPDAALLTVAEQGKLRDSKALHGQVERMLKHPKAKAFTENFLGQWLNLREIDFTAPDFRLYPEYDEMLKTAMLGEAHLFFNEVLGRDLDLSQFVSSDFTFLNERLAKHYAIPGVEGHALRKTTLPADSHRGGFLTMGAVLKVTANGTSTSPVTRGAWVLDRILGTPPAPPPSGVAAVEPDIRGATTIREQLAKHRQVASCASCHVKIDPPGFALESFDVIGGWRDNYRSLGRGDVVMVEGRRMAYHKGPKVDPADTLPDGRAFKNIDELKRLLAKDKDQLARSLAAQLLTYATGAPPAEGDKPGIEMIVAETRSKDYGFRSLVHALVESTLFQSK